MTRVQFQADADLNQAIVTGVIRRQSNISFQTSTEAGLEGLKDLEVLALSAKQQRILVTHDRRTMPTEFAEFIANSQSAGVKRDFLRQKKFEIECNKLNPQEEREFAEWGGFEDWTEKY